MKKYQNSVAFTPWRLQLQFGKSKKLRLEFVVLHLPPRLTLDELKHQADIHF